MRRLIPLRLLLSLAVLFAFNLLMISSLAPSLFWKQLLSWIIGGALLFIGTQINPKQNRSTGTFFFILSCLLVLAPIIVGSFTRGSRRWLYLGPLSVQPSEIVKGPLMLFLSTTTIPLLHLIPVAIVMAQPDLGSAMSIFILIIPIILYNKKLFRFSLLAAIALTLLAPFIYGIILKPYQKERITSFISHQSGNQSQNYTLDEGYNLIQAQIAIGSGSFFGKGYRKGTQGQLLYLPEKHSDFIFSATAEELGLFAILIILTCYYIIIDTLFRKAFSTTTNLPLFLFTLGIAFQLCFQCFINIGMNIGILPITGIPLPFMSVGGSSIMSLLFSFGIIYSA